MIEQISRDPVPELDSDLTVCPVCHRSDRIEKASSVVRRGSGTIFLPNLGGPQPFVSSLAQTLTPPSLPNRMTFGDAVANTIGSLLIGGFILLVIMGIRAIGALGVPDAPANVASAMTLLWFGLLIPVASFFKAGKDGKRVQLLRPQYLRARARWEETYYCGRDDVVFLAESDSVERPERMPELLMAGPFSISEGVS